MEEVNKNGELDNTDKKSHMYSFSDIKKFSIWLLDINDYGAE
jgi:hypothetical protein